MTTSDSPLRTAPAASLARPLLGGRPAVVAAAILAPLLVWLVARVAFGLDVRSPTFKGQHFEIGPPLVLLTALIPCLLGWALLAILERVTARARAIWTTVALIGLMVSLGTPLSGTGVSAGNRMALVLMHLAVGGVLIPGLAYAPGRRS
jgi:hypothetical protein